MAITLKKGQKIDLTKGNPSLKNLKLGLGWDIESILISDWTMSNLAISL